MKKTKDIFLKIILFPFLFPVLLGLIIFTPLDYFLYKKSRYYKDTREKYSWLCTSSYYIELYNLIKKENLPIDYYRCHDSRITGYGFFLYKDTLILSGYDPCVYDEEKNIWLVEIEDEYVDIEVDVKVAIDRCNELINNVVCTNAVVLIDKDTYEKHPNVRYENIRFLPMGNKLKADDFRPLMN